MIKKNRVHGFADPVVSPEGERKVADPAAYLAVRKVLLYPFDGPYEIYRVIVMFIDSRCHCKHIGIEDYILRRESEFLSQDIVRSPGNFYPSLKGICLSSLIEQHHHRRSSVLSDLTGMIKEDLLPFLEAYRVYHRFALNAFQGRFDDAPFR